MVDVYESDFGICRVVMSRWVPADTVLLLESSRIDVLPLAGRSFMFKPLARTGDSESGQVIGEYTCELRNENAHAMLNTLGNRDRVMLLQSAAAQAPGTGVPGLCISKEYMKEYHAPTGT